MPLTIAHALRVSACPVIHLPPVKAPIILIRPLAVRAIVVLLGAGFLPAVNVFAQSGIVTVCDKETLAAAVSQGGHVTFGCDGTIALNFTLTISQDTILDASGHNVIISGNNSFRPFYVNPGVHFTLLNLTIINGSNVGTNAAASQTAGQDGMGGRFIIMAGRSAPSTASLLAIQPLVGPVPMAIPPEETGAVVMVGPSSMTLEFLILRTASS